MISKKWMAMGLGMMLASALVFGEDAKKSDGKTVVSDKAISTGMSAECEKAMAAQGAGEKGMGGKNMADCPRHGGTAAQGAGAMDAKDCPKHGEGAMDAKDCPRHADGSMDKDCPKGGGHCAKCAKKHQHGTAKGEAKTDKPSLSGEPPAAGSTVPPAK